MMSGPVGGAAVQPGLGDSGVASSMIGPVGPRNGAPVLSRNKRDCIKAVCANSSQT